MTNIFKDIHEWNTFFRLTILDRKLRVVTDFKLLRPNRCDSNDMALIVSINKK